MGVKDSSDCTSFTGWTTVSEIGWPQISNGFIANAHAIIASFDTVGEYRTTGQTIAAGDIFWWVMNSDQVGTDRVHFHLIRDSAGIAYNSGGTIRAGVLWTYTAGNTPYVVGWDTSTDTAGGSDTGIRYSANTNYECKGTVNANGTVTYKFRLLSGGSWTTIGSTTLGNTPTLIAQTVYFGKNAYSTAINAIHYLKGFSLSTAPSVDAGGDQAVRLEDGATLDATVVLGNPTATTTWSKVSGPGTVTFGSASSVDTTASFSAVGWYILRLTLTDGDFTVTDDVEILVVGNGEHITKHDNFLTDSGFFTYVQTAGTVARSGGKLVFTSSGDAWDVCGAWAAWGTSSPGMRMYYTFYDPVTNGNNINTTRTANGITKAVGAGGNYESGGAGKVRCWESNANQCTGLPSSSARGNGIHHMYAEIQSNGTVKHFYAGPNLATPTLLFTTSATNFGSGTIYAGFNNFNSASPGSIGNFTVTIVNVGPVVNAGPDQTVELGEIIQLDGSATDDGLPAPPGALTYLWEQLSGPSTVVFTDATDPQTTVEPPTRTGQYVLRLTASDGELESSDNVTITVVALDAETLLVLEELS